MKDLLIIIGTVVLGCLLFAMIAGNERSLKSAGRAVMEKSIEMYEERP